VILNFFPDIVCIQHGAHPLPRLHDHCLVIALNLADTLAEFFLNRNCQRIGFACAGVTISAGGSRPARRLTFCKRQKKVSKKWLSPAEGTSCSQIYGIYWRR
jgi:hypothetical protein